MSAAPDGEGRESLHGWSLAMAVVSLAAMALWIAAPRALPPGAMALAHAVWTVLAFGVLFARIGGHRRRADRITAVRALLCPVLFAAHALAPSPAWWKVGLALGLIALDGVDGALARRDGPTERGAVFDMESDAFLVITLCAVAHLYLGVTALVFVLGAMRPLYVVAWAALQRIAPARTPNHEGSLRGRLIHNAVVLALLVDLAPGAGPAAKNGVTMVATALILYSYAADVAHGRRSAASHRRDPVL
jgi:phosphatidylglycerophosphate synthase